MSKFYLHVLLLAAAAWSAVQAGPTTAPPEDPLPPPTCLLFIGGTGQNRRPAHTLAVPSVHFSFNGLPYTATRHHVIPFRTLRAFFEVVTEAHASGRLQQYARSRINAIYRYFVANPGMGGVSDDHRRRWSTGPDGVFEPNMRMMAAFTWIPANLFYGPDGSVRSDDPGDQFEEHAGPIVGQNFEVLRRLNANMERYTAPQVARSREGDTLLDVILDDLITIGMRESPYELNMAQWETVREPGRPLRFRIRTNHRALPAPVRPNPDVAEFTPQQTVDAAREVCKGFESPSKAPKSPKKRG